MEEITDRSSKEQQEVPELTLSTMEEERRNEELYNLLGHIMSCYGRQDYVRKVVVHPDDLELVTSWLNGLEIPEMIKRLIEVVPRAGDGLQIGVITQSQIETEWLSRHFEDMGLMKYIRAKGAPLMLTHQELKLLFLLQGIKECEAERKRIIVPT